MSKQAGKIRQQYDTSSRRSIIETRLFASIPSIYHSPFASRPSQAGILNVIIAALYYTSTTQHKEKIGRVPPNPPDRHGALICYDKCAWYE